MRLKGLSVAMVQPRFGLNIGYVARTMKNFGVEQLFVVGRGDIPPSAIRFASHGGDILRRARYLSLHELRSRFDLLIGTTAVVGGKGRNPARKTISLGRMATTGMDPTHSVIVLGRDTTGLTAQELEECDLVVHLRTGTSYPTLNISHALAIILFELSTSGLAPRRPIDRGHSDRLLEQFSAALVAGGYPTHKRRIAIRTMGQMIAQSGIKQEEVVAMIGAFRKINLALERRF